jgi:hypothetical protein
MRPDTEDELERSVPTPLVWITIGVAGTLGYAIGDRVMRAFNDTKAGHHYAALPEVRVHYALLAGQVAFWFIFAPILWTWFADLRHRFKARANPWLVLASIVAMGAVIYLPFQLSRGNHLPPVPGYAYRTPLVYGLGLVLFVPALFLLATIDAGSRDNDPPNTTPQYVAEYFVLRSALRRVAIVLGAAVSLIVVATGGYLNAGTAFAAHHPKFSAPPQASLLVYGALFVAVLIALFLPVFNALRQRAEMIVNEHAALEAPQSKTLVEVLQHRASLRSALGLDESSRQLLERGLIVLSPLLSAAIATFVNR